MREIFRRKVRVCSVCDERLDTIAARRACETKGHTIVVREQGIWWITYLRDGRRQIETSRSGDKAVAEALLGQREGVPPPSPAVMTTAPIPQVPSHAEGVSFEDAAQDLLNDYQMNRRKSLRTVKIRVNKHLRPAFGYDALTAITTARLRCVHH